MTTARGPVALVLSGGGARGAYEIGVLSVLLPALAKRKELPSIVVGTSVGALNAAWLAAHAHLDVDALLQAALPVWPGIRFSEVVRPLVSIRGTIRLGRYLAGAALGGGRLDMLLDSSPLTATVPRLIPFDRLPANVRAGRVTLAVAATSVRTGRTVVFVDGTGPVPGEDAARGIEYVKVRRLTADHVRASAAIPAVFPAVFVDDEVMPGWYIDGGTRMNTPIKPAISLGAARVVIVGLNGTRADDSEATNAAVPPDVFDGAAHILQGLLADPLAADVRTLASTNEMVLGATRETAAGKTAIPYIFVAPERRDAIGELARDVYLEHLADGSLRASRRDLALLGRLIGAGRNDMHGELFSYVSFAREFAEALIDRGRRDAGAWLARTHDDGPWRIGRLPEEPRAARLS